MPMPRVFTVIILTHNRPEFLRIALAALRRQTYRHLEIVVLVNGATPKTIECVREAAAADARVKPIYFSENQYRQDDPQHVIHVCFNAGLQVAAGDYVWYQNDDDLLADDYAEKMVALFEGHPECTTAAGVPMSIDLHGRVIESGPRTVNHRPRYVPGHLLALDVLGGGSRMFSAPGTIFTIKREVLRRAGGYHRAIELSHLYGIVPFGVTGFDETAITYWRRHEGQLNRRLSAQGWIGFRESCDLLRDWELERRWQVFGALVARQVVSDLERQLCSGAAEWCANHALAGRPGASWCLLRQAGRHPWFWRELPGHLATGLRREVLDPGARKIGQWVRTRVHIKGVNPTGACQGAGPTAGQKERVSPVRSV